MISIVKAKKDDFQLLADIGRTTLLESHEKSAAAEDLNVYVETNFAYDVVKEELIDAKNLYHLIYYDGQPAGYSKIVLNADHPNIQLRHVTKLDRLYLRKEFYSLKLGFELFNFNNELSRQNAQAGMWLFVWQGNRRAINFYLKAGFEITGNYTFKLSENHSNPSYQMLLTF